MSESERGPGTSVSCPRSWDKVDVEEKLVCKAFFYFLIFRSQINNLTPYQIIIQKLGELLELCINICVTIYDSVREITVTGCHNINVHNIFTYVEILRIVR
jgi:hypothetical protein